MAIACKEYPSIRILNSVRLHQFIHSYHLLKESLLAAEGVIEALPNDEFSGTGGIYIQAKRLEIRDFQKFTEAISLLDRCSLYLAEERYIERGYGGDDVVS